MIVTTTVESKAMKCVHQVFDVTKRNFISFSAIFMGYLLRVVISLDQIANPSKYRIEEPVQHETVSSMNVYILVVVYISGVYLFHHIRRFAKMPPRLKAITTWNSRICHAIRYNTNDLYRKR